MLKRPSSGNPRRRSIRLRGWDYRSAGAYFITICTHGGEPLFGDVLDGAVRLSEYGRIVEVCWLSIPAHFADVELDAFIVMPNHVHGIIILPCTGDACVARTSAPVQRPGPLPKSLGAIVGSFKSASARRINESRGMPGAPIWHRNYWDHIIRHERALDAVRQYIAGNPARWALDPYNPAGPRGFAIRARG